MDLDLFVNLAFLEYFNDILEYLDLEVNSINLE